MSEQFVPFGPAGGTSTRGQARFQARIVPQTSTTKPFTPASTGPVAASPHTCSTEPRVNVRREGNRITYIEVHCACGKHLEIECVY